MKKTKKVDTAKKGQTTKKEQPEKVIKALAEIKQRRKNKQLNIDDVKKETKVPTGKIKSKSPTQIKKEREERYRTFRIAALRRRCDRLGYTKEETEKYVKELEVLLDAPKQYRILIMYKVNESAMITQAIMNKDIKIIMSGTGFCYVDGDNSVLDTVRSLEFTSMKVYPYAKKIQSVLPAKEPEKQKPKKSKLEKKTAALAAKKARKKKNIMAHNDRKLHAKERMEEKNKATRKTAKSLKLFKKRALKASKKRTGKIAQAKPKKAQNGSKMASNVKKAA